MILKQVQLFTLEFTKRHGIEIIGIVILFLIGRVILRKTAKHIIRITTKRNRDAKQRLKTISHIVFVTGDIVIYAIILFMILDMFNIDIIPIVTGAGLIALLVGFGSQSLVKDFVSGLFIIIEDRYSIGDRIKVGSLEGKVVKIGIRSTILRDEEKNVYYLSNGAINNVVNLSQETKFRNKK